MILFPITVGIPLPFYHGFCRIQAIVGPNRIGEGASLSNSRDFKERRVRHRTDRSTTNDVSQMLDHIQTALGGEANV
jgi:hypothetical protein